MSDKFHIYLFNCYFPICDAAITRGYAYLDMPPYWSCAPNEIDFSVVNNIYGKCITLNLTMNSNSKNVKFYLNKKLRSKKDKIKKIYESKNIKRAYLKIFKNKIEVGLNLNEGTYLSNSIVYEKKIKFR
jgi:hypothetical protein